MATRKKKTGRKKKNKPRPSPITLRLDAAIYSLQALRQAQKAFAHLAAIRIRRQGNHHLVSFGKGTGTSGEILADEFANFALSCLMVAP
jgi:hypothetical protein